MISPGRRDLDFFSGLLTALRPRLEGVLRRYQIPPGDAQHLLEEAILELIYKASYIDDPAQWLALRLSHKCRIYWVTRRRLVAEAVGRVFPRR